VSYAKTAKPIEMLFGMWTWVDQRKHVLNGGVSLRWRHITNTIEPPMFGEAVLMFN